MVQSKQDIPNIIKRKAIAMYKSNFIYGPFSVDLNLEIQETECIFTKAVRLLGFAIWTTKKQFSTLLEAEETYDTTCLVYTTKGYIDGPTN